ncbi:MAG: hypothetical protein IPG58_16070 [Acidobacteria bacterium]|nr:hypothetical protein [Acidobacteriota bacterium]
MVRTKILQNVAILKLRSLEKYPDGLNEETFSVGNIKRSILTVEKVFKGKLKVGQELPFRQGGGADCVWTFSDDSIGNEYLLYLDAKPEKTAFGQDTFVLALAQRSIGHRIYSI